jgi:hypothetical protein
MTLEIVNAEGIPAPRDGTIFNAQFSDGSVTKVRWSLTKGDWEGGYLPWPVAGARISTSNNAAQDVVAGVAAR